LKQQVNLLPKRKLEPKLGIEAEASVTQARLKAEASTIRSAAELKQIKMRQDAEAFHQLSLNTIEISKTRHLAHLESQKFMEIVEAIGRNTIASICQAGPDLQARLLKGLGLKSFLLTDANNPINMFATSGGAARAAHQRDADDVEDVDF